MGGGEMATQHSIHGAAAVWVGFVPLLIDPVISLSSSDAGSKILGAAAGHPFRDGREPSSPPLGIVCSADPHHPSGVSSRTGYGEH
eukprot:COSAG01_NODE_2169_length_8243_cov_3.244720_5_plen_86_part_00